MRLSQGAWQVLYHAAAEPDQYQLPGWIAQITIAQVLGLFCALLVIGWVVRTVWRFFAPLHDFADDWRGEPARDGVAARPGVMSRIATVEKTAGELHTLALDTNRRLERIEEQMHPNGGSTIRDSLDRLERHVTGQRGDQ